MVIADNYGIELCHPVRSGPDFHQAGRKSKSNHRWIIGGKLCIVINQLGLITDWDCRTANVHYQTFRHLLEYYDCQMIILADRGFHRAKGDPANVKICRRGERNVRMAVETTFATMTTVWAARRCDI